jgi:hypothetical protein
LEVKKCAERGHFTGRKEILQILQGLKSNDLWAVSSDVCKKIYYLKVKRGDQKIEFVFLPLISAEKKEV